VAGTANQTGLAERQEEAVFVKFSPTSDRLWVGTASLQRTDDNGSSRFFDDTRALVADNQGNLYSIAITQRTTDDSTSFSSHLVSFDRNGEQRWTRKLSDQEDMRALAINGDQVVVSGLSTQRFSLTGDKLSHVDQIGRASRRERVWVPVAAGSSRNTSSEGPTQEAAEP